MVRFLANSDLHYSEDPREEKAHQIGEMLTLLRNQPVGQKIKSVLLVGDLTDRGISYDRSLGGCCVTREHQDQLKYLQDRCIKPMEMYTTVLPCSGNHDTYHSGRAQKWIDKTYGRNRQRTIDGISFISMGVYPDKKALKYLDTLSSDTLKLPTIFYWHYPPVGPYNDWWKPEEKESASKSLSKFDNILGIFCGHAHGSYHMTWKSHDIYVVGGPYFADVECSKDKLEITWRNNYNTYTQVERSE